MAQYRSRSSASRSICSYISHILLSPTGNWPDHTEGHRGNRVPALRYNQTKISEGGGSLLLLITQFTSLPATTKTLTRNHIIDTEAPILDVILPPKKTYSLGLLSCARIIIVTSKDLLEFHDRDTLEGVKGTGRLY